MKAPIPYTYVVAAKRRRNRVRWALAVLRPDGLAETMTLYASRARAVSAARLLAGSLKRVEIRP